MKKIIFTIIIASLAISCKEKTQQETTNRKTHQYVLTLYRDKYDPNKKSFVENDSISTVESENDTTVYLLALNTFYNEKVKQRELLNYGQPKNFLIVDKSKIDISLKLTARMVDGFQAQVKSRPEISKMLEDYNRDSLVVDSTNIK